MSKNENPEVKCLVCGRGLKAVAAHIRLVHQMSVEEYQQWCKDNDLGVPDLGWTVKKHANGNNTPQQNLLNAAKEKNPVADQMETLSESENVFYEKRFEILFRQTDFDPALEPSVRQIVMNEIIAERYQAYVNNMTLKLRPGADMSKALENAHKVLKDINAMNLSLMDKMNITREKKQAQKKHVETTPSRLITAYQQEYERLSTEERRRLREDEEDATRRWHHNQAALLELVPSSASGDDDDESA